MTQTPDPTCQHCSGTGLTLLMEDCPCAANHFAEAVDHYAPVPVMEAFLDEFRAGISTITPPPSVDVVSSPTHTAPTPAGSATPGQISFMKTLIAERDAGHAYVIAATTLLADRSGLLSKALASKTIEHLLSIPKMDVEGDVRPNKYPGECENCSGPVPVGAGRIVKIDGKWKTFHLTGKCMDEAAAKAFEADKVCEPGVYRQDVGDECFYYRVRPGRYDKSAFWAERIHASRFGVTFSRAGRATFLKASERLDWKEARAIGVAYSACINCGRSLSDDPSLLAGYGKTCANTCGWPYPSIKVTKAVLAGLATWPPE